MLFLIQLTDEIIADLWLGNKPKEKKMPISIKIGAVTSFKAKCGGLHISPNLNPIPNVHSVERKLEDNNVNRSQLSQWKTALHF